MSLKERKFGALMALLKEKRYKAHPEVSEYLNTWECAIRITKSAPDMLPPQSALLSLFKNLEQYVAKQINYCLSQKKQVQRWLKLPRPGFWTGASKEVSFPFQLPWLQPVEDEVLLFISRDSGCYLLRLGHLSFIFQIHLCSY